MLDDAMKTMIDHHSIGCVATIGADGVPAVSPKATFLLVDDATLAFAHIRSPGTVANLAYDARLEIDFIDPFHRTALRVRGTGRYHALAAIDPALRERFRTAWPDLFPLMHGIVVIAVERAEAVSSPSYDTGATADDLAETWLRRFASELGFTVTRAG